MGFWQISRGDAKTNPVAKRALRILFHCAAAIARRRDTFCDKG